eukprot:6378735-Pyramimonas_sp.AAC.1
MPIYRGPLSINSADNPTREAAISPAHLQSACLKQFGIPRGVTEFPFLFPLGRPPQQNYSSG